MAAKSISRRVTDLEEREGIVYSFMDDLRKWAMQLQAERKEHKLRLRELEIGNEETRQMIRAVNVLHVDSQQRIAQNEKMIETMEARLNLLEGRQNGSKK